MASRRSFALLRSLWPSSSHNVSPTSSSPFFIRPFSSLPGPLAPMCRPPASPILCGRGDKKTKKGKRFRGKFGNSRPNREHQIRRIRERWEQPPGTPWPVPGLSVEDYRPVF